MRLWPFKSKKTYSGGVELRPSFGQGPWTPFYQNFIARKVDPILMEVMRESIPVVDVAINRLVSLDGHIEIKGDSDKLVDEITDWVDNVPVNGLSSGLQKFHQNFTDEAHEQGFAIGEAVPDKKRSGIIELRVADSKSIKFKRNATSYDILQRSDDDHEFRPLKPGNLMYFSIHNENMNPYGIPLMRSCEFVTQILHTIQNSIKNSWERFGDPSFSVVYKTSKKDGANHNERRIQISKELDEAMRAKKDGKSVDFVRAIDKDSDITIQVIGADGQILEMEVPARHVLEQIIAKTGLPAWMLGMHWSTTERLSNAELEMLMADMEVRRRPKLSIFKNLIATELRMRGRTWKKGDWWIEWAGVNMRDAVAQAQARFLNAQADMYYLQNAGAAGIQIDISDLALGKCHCGKTKDAVVDVRKTAGSCAHGTKETGRAEPWPELDDIETRYAERLKKDWHDLYERVRLILGFDIPGKTAEAAGFVFSPEQMAMIRSALESFIKGYDPALSDSPIVTFYREAMSAGVIRAAGGETPKLNLAKNTEIYDTLKSDGFNLVKNNATKAIQDKIIAEMQAHSLAGSNPLEVAGRLKKLFDDKNSDWERLARSEMAMSAEKAKKAEWKEWGIEKLEFFPAPDACPICRALAGEYEIDDCPVPVADTHPNCRCATRPGN